MQRFLRAAALIFAVSLVGCGSPGNDISPGAGASPGAESPVTGEPGTTDPVTDPHEGARRVEPRSGVQDPYPHAFERAEVGPDDRTVTVFYWSGIRECYGLDRVEVDLRKEEVTITLYEGWVGGEEACIDLAQSFKTIVELEEPLAGREIVDGAD